MAVLTGGVLDSLLETMTGIIMAGYLRTGAAAEHEDARQVVKEFLTKNEAKLRLWIQTNPGERPPVYFIDGRKVVWLSRRQRRKKELMEAAARAKAARALCNRSSPTPKSSSSESSPAEPPKGGVDEKV